MEKVSLNILLTRMRLRMFRQMRVASTSSELSSCATNFLAWMGLVT